MCQQNNQEQFIDVETSQGVKSAFSQAINTFAYILNQMAYTKTIEDSLETMCEIKNKLNQQNSEQISLTEIQEACILAKGVKDYINVQKTTFAPTTEQNYIYNVCKDVTDELVSMLQNSKSISDVNEQLKQLYYGLRQHYLREE